MLKMTNENHNTIILNFILHGKSNAGRPIKKYTVVTEGKHSGHWHIVRDVNDDDGVYWTAACYTVED
jgi:hypothetical protein